MLHSLRWYELQANKTWNTSKVCSILANWYAQTPPFSLATPNSPEFCPSGRAWAAVTTEGLLIYSLDSGITFDPYDLSVDINPDSIEVALNNAHYSDALMMSFKLNEKELISRSLEAVPTTDSKPYNNAT